MNTLEELENHILELFQEKGADAKEDIQKFLSPNASLKKRAAIRNIMSRMEVTNDGTYFLK